MLSLSTLAYELVKNICCDFCQQKMSNLTTVTAAMGEGEAIGKWEEYQEAFLSK